MIDANVLLPPWPFRRLPVQTTDELASALERHHVEEAWVGSAESCFQRDLASVNERLHRACRSIESLRLVPWGAVNPVAPDWREDARRCRESYGMAGLRLTPACHGYRLDAPQLADVFGWADEEQVPVSLILAFEDARTQHPMLRLPPVETAPLAGLVERYPRTKIVLLNAWRSLSMDAAQELASTGQVYFELSMLEGVDRLSRLVERVGSTRVLFGSWFPLFYVESALLKLRETKAPPEVIDRIRTGNARGLLGGSG